MANGGERQLLAFRRAGDRVSRVEAMVGYWLRRLYSGAKEEERASLGCVRAVRGCDKEAEASKRLSRRNESINQSINQEERERCRSRAMRHRRDYKQNSCSDRHRKRFEGCLK